MKTLTILFGAVLIFTLHLAHPLPIDEDHNQDIADNGNNRTVHFYVLMIPDSVVQELLKERARQEEEGGEIVSETGAYVGQIISGVLGGDIRPVFAGSASFIGEPDVQQGVSTILANVAPSVNNILKQWVNRAQTFLGISTTPKPGTVLANQTNANGTTTGGKQPQILVLPVAGTPPPLRKPDEDDEESDRNVVKA